MGLILCSKTCVEKKIIRCGKAQEKAAFCWSLAKEKTKSTLTHTYAHTYGQKTRSHCVHRHAWGRSAMFQLIPHTGGQRSPFVLPIRRLWFCACLDALNQATMSVRPAPFNKKFCLKNHWLQTASKEDCSRVIIKECSSKTIKI